MPHTNLCKPWISSPEQAYSNFQGALRHALTVSKDEMERRIAEDNAARTADRVQRGYKKRGPKAKAKKLL